MADPRYLDVVVGAVAQSMWRQDAEGRLTLLRSLRDMLTHFVPVEDDPAPREAKSTIMFALDPSNPWSSSGINPDDRVIWESFGFTPSKAKGWTTLKVNAPLALLLEKAGMEPEMYKKIIHFYEVDVTDKERRWNLEHLVVQTFSSGNPSPGNAMKWLSIGVPLEDISDLILRGYTPAKAKRLFERGESIESLKMKTPEAYPGPAFRSVKKAADENGWKMVTPDAKGYWYSTPHIAALEKNGTKITFGMGNSGRMRKYFWLEGPNAKNFAQGRNYGYSGRFHMSTGLKGILEIVNSI